jgi:hypothetical protein
MKFLIAAVLGLNLVACATMLPPVQNPALQVEGVIAVRGVQLVSVIRAAQLSLEPLVDARVITATEALKAADAFGVVLSGCDTLVNLLRTADATRDTVERVQALRAASQKTKDVLQTLTGIPGQISSDAGKMAVSASTSKVINAVAELVPALGGVQ